MSTNEKIREANDLLFNKLCTKLKKEKKIKIEVEYKSNYKTLSFKSYECFMRLYFGDKLGIYIRFNTINCSDEVFWNYSEESTEVNDFELYKEITYKYLTTLIAIRNNITFCPEWHTEMVPHIHNEIVGLIGNVQWYEIYEKTLGYTCTYSNFEELKRWLLITNDKVFMKDIANLGK